MLRNIAGEASTTEMGVDDKLKTYLNLFI